MKGQGKALPLYSRSEHSPGMSDTPQTTSKLLTPLRSWRALIFYLYAESIQFAPLRSQGARVRARYIQEMGEENPHMPPPCSPKTIYSLAGAVCPYYVPGLGSCRLTVYIQLKIYPLRDLALSNIRSKITSVNVVNEFFSKFTSQ